MTETISGTRSELEQLRRESEPLSDEEAAELEQLRKSRSQRKDLTVARDQRMLTLAAPPPAKSPELVAFEAELQQIDAENTGWARRLLERAALVRDRLPANALEELGIVAEEYNPKRAMLSHHMNAVKKWEPLIKAKLEDERARLSKGG